MEFPGGSDGKASAYNARDPGLIPGSGRSPGEGNGAPLQYTCLENPMDEAWWATVHGVAKSQIQLSNFASHHSVVSKSLNVKYVVLHICCLVSFTFHISSTFYLYIFLAI